MLRCVCCLLLPVWLAACGADSSDAADDGMPDVSASLETVTGDGAMDVVGDGVGDLNQEVIFTISVDVTFPAGAVVEGYRPVAAVYKKSDYSDFSLRPGKSPLGFLLGTDGSGTLSGTMLDWAQAAEYEFPEGEYSVLLGIAKATGLPKPEAGKMFTARAIRTDTPDTLVVITAEDVSWTPY